MNQPLSSIMSEDWAAALAPVEEQIHAMGAFLREEHAAGYRTFPPAADIFNAFRRPMSGVKVLIIGQDPYPTPGNAMGLSFSVHRGMPLPRSLNNIYKELQDDLGIAPADHGDLSCWADEGVMLLNRVLTVRESDAGSHRGKGWEEITECAIRALVARNQPLVGLLWGADARKCAPMLQPYPERGVSASFATVCSSWFLWFAPVLDREFPAGATGRGAGGLDGSLGAT